MNWLTSNVSVRCFKLLDAGAESVAMEDRGLEIGEMLEMGVPSGLAREGGTNCVAMVIQVLWLLCSGFRVWLFLAGVGGGLGSRCCRNTTSISFTLLSTDDFSGDGERINLLVAGKLVECVGDEVRFRGWLECAKDEVRFRG